MAATNRMDQAESVVQQEFKFLVSAGVVLMVMAWVFGHYALIRTTPTGWIDDKDD